MTENLKLSLELANGISYITTGQWLNQNYYNRLLSVAIIKFYFFSIIQNETKYDNTINAINSFNPLKRCNTMLNQSLFSTYIQKNKIECFYTVESADVHLFRPTKRVSPIRQTHRMSKKKRIWLKVVKTFNVILLRAYQTSIQRDDDDIPIITLMVSPLKTFT